MTIYQRIGEAIASQGKVTLVAALTYAEEEILKHSGFKKAGTMDLNGTNVDLYEVKVTQVINTQAPYTGIRAPQDNTYPGTKPTKYEQQWPESYRLTTGTPPDDQYRGSTTSSLMEAASNPLSILEDYFFPQNNTDGRGNSVETVTLKIDIGDLPKGEVLDYVEKLKNEIHKTATDNAYCDDSWTSYNQNYKGHSANRGW